MSDFLKSPRFPVSQAELQHQTPLFRDYLFGRMSQLVVAAVEGSPNVELALGGELLRDFSRVPDEFQETNLHDPAAVKHAILHDDFSYTVDIPRGEGSRLRLSTKNNVAARAYLPSFEQVRLERAAERQKAQQIDSLAPPAPRDDQLIRALYDSTPASKDLLRYLPTFQDGNLLYSFSTEPDWVYEIAEKGRLHIHVGDDHSVEDDLAMHNGWYNALKDEDAYFPLLDSDRFPDPDFTYFAQPQRPHPNPRYEAIYQRYGSASVAMAYMHDVAITLETTQA